MSIKSILKAFKLGAAGVLAMAAYTHAQNGEWMINNNTVNDWSRWSYVDFATSTIAGHSGNPTGTFAGVAGLKYKSLQLNGGNSINGAQCFEVFTTHPMFIPAALADTRIWIVSHLGSQASPVGLNDDIDGANNRYSAARVWLKGAPSSFVNLEIASYDTQAANNTAHFSLVVNQLPLTEAACTTGQAKPWVKVINGTMTLSANAH